MRKLLPVMSVFLSLSFFQWRRPSATGAPSVIVDSKCCSVAPVGARTLRNFEITLKACCQEDVAVKVELETLFMLAVHLIEGE